jgi:spore cortex formation protein SpoVR/YcgB (stage V sporulation)
MAALKAIPQNQFKNCFEGWTTRWHRCIVSQGEYFEGDHSDIQQLGMCSTFTAISSRTLLSDHVFHVRKRKIMLHVKVCSTASMNSKPLQLSQQVHNNVWPFTKHINERQGNVIKL